MTILYILISTDPYSGSTKSFLILLKGVLEAGVKAIVVVPDCEGIYATLQDMGVEVIVQYSKGNTWTGARNLKQKILYLPRQMGRLLIEYWACRRLWKTFEGRHIDVVHSNNTVTNLGRYVSRKMGLPHLFHIREYGNRDFDLHYFPTTASFRRHLKSPGVYTACITKDIQRHHELSEWASSRVIYNGIFDHCVDFDALEGTRDFYLFAGRIEPTKGLLTLVKAYADYAQIVDNPLPLKVAGGAIDAAYMKQIERVISEHGLERRVLFLGQVSDMAALYANAKAIVIPSEFEGFGRCMPEAMLYGCIAIGRNTGGTQEQLDNGVEMTGHEIGFRYDTVDELARTLVRVHQLDAESCLLLRHRAYDVVTKLYSAKTYVESVLDYYRSILRK